MAQTCQRTLQTVVLLGAATMMVACDAERSSNPLSPNIAGPLAGITITTPASIQPVDGQLIAADTQPVTLVFQSAVSDSPRPFWHEAQIAADGNFVSILHTFENISLDEGDMVSFELPLTLDPERIYHWRTRAVDGANAGPYSNGASFDIYSPVTVGAPTLALPADGATTQTDAPLLSVDTTTVGGPASNIIYQFEISPTPIFSSFTAVLNVSPSTGPITSAQPGDLGYDLTHYWRVHIRATGRTGEVVGPFSATRSFRTPPPPVVLGIPVPSSPNGGATSPTTRPTYIVNDGTVSGSAGTVTYQVQVSTDTDFVTIVDSPSMIRSSTGQTFVASQVDLAADTVYYWRARATNGTLTTSWSTTAVFRTPSSGGGGGGGGDELNLSQVTWLHANISGWTASSTVTGVTLPGAGGTMCIFHTQAGAWPLYVDNGVEGEGNAWIFANIGGQWYGGTFEWLRPGQQCKPVITRENIGPHVKQSPLSSWVPQSGEVVGVAMSTPARSNLRTSNQRTNVVLVTWP